MGFDQVPPSLAARQSAAEIHEKVRQAGYNILRTDLIAAGHEELARQLEQFRELESEGNFDLAGDKAYGEFTAQVLTLGIQGKIRNARKRILAAKAQLGLLEN